MIISSKDNPKIKEINRLKNNNSDKTNTRIFIEGEKLCSEAFLSGMTIDKLVLSETKFSEYEDSIKKASGEIIIVRDSLFRVLSETSSPQGVIAIVRSKIIPEEKFAEEIKSSGTEKRRYLVSENIQDPGNFGSIIRSADAFGFDGVIFTKGNVHPFNNKAIQSSMGSVFHIDLIYTENLKLLLRKFREFNFTVYATHLDGKEIDTGIRFADKSVIILGNEGNGISSDAAAESNELIKIPMTGKAQSLNVANAASIICFLSNQKSDIMGKV